MCVHNARAHSRETGLMQLMVELHHWQPFLILPMPECSVEGWLINHRENVRYQLSVRDGR